jgi:hypothetical protein
VGISPNYPYVSAIRAEPTDATLDDAPPQSPPAQLAAATQKNGRAENHQMTMVTGASIARKLTRVVGPDHQRDRDSSDDLPTFRGAV